MTDVNDVRYRGTPEVATPRQTARTLATFYGFGGLTGLLAAAGAQGSPDRRWAMVAMSLMALAVGAVMGLWGARWARVAFHAMVLLATATISIAAVVAPDPTTALLVAMIITFVAMDAFFFFPFAEGAAQLAVALAGVTVALRVRGDLPLPHVLGVAAVVVAISLVTSNLAQWASRASRDQLTGLRNRRGFDAALQEAVAESERTGVVLAAALLDLDHFKSINDSAGHDAGDRALQRLADQWSQALPRRAVLARHGGDEFAVLLPGWDGAAALDLVRRVSAELPDPAVSCGVAEHRPGDSAAQLMRRADSALYDAKAAGRGRCELRMYRPTPASPARPDVSTPAGPPGPSSRTDQGRWSRSCDDTV